MNQQMRMFPGMLARAVALGLLVFSCASDGWAQQKAPRLQDQIVGGWTLVSVVLQQGDKKIEPYGANPNGFTSFQRNGRFSHMIIRSDLPRIASGNRTTPTPDEMKLVYLGTTAYYGKYTLDEKKGELTLHIESSSYANWNGTNEKRLITISGDEMKLTNPTPFMGGTAHLVLKRAK